jgi:periplasmic divalent cation tolerance protein
VPRIALIYVPCPSSSSAQRIARRLLELRLVACANIVASSSAYRWRGAIARAKEHILIAKTSARNVAVARREIEAAHPHDVPCILTIAADANAPYAAWVRESVGNRSSRMRSASGTR